MNGISVTPVERIDSLADYFSEFETGRFNLWFEDRTVTKGYLLFELEQEKDNLKIWKAETGGRCAGVIAFSPLAFDTEFFKMRCGRVYHLSLLENLSSETKRAVADALVLELLDYFKKIELEFCSICVESTHSTLSFALQDAGFKYVLTRLDCFNRTGAGGSLEKGYQIRPLADKDLEFAASLAKSYFKGGRFHLDPGFTDQQADSIYEALVRNSARDDNCTMNTLYRGDVPIGCLISKKIIYPFSRKLSVKSLRLLIFDKKRAKPKLASAFFAAATDKLLETCDMAVSGIEIHNGPSMAIHIKSRYIFNHSYSLYHWWRR